MDGSAIQPVEHITDADTLNKICQDVTNLGWINQHVTSIVVRDAGTVIGSVHPIIGHMTSLTKLDLTGSTVHYLPYFLSNLVQLQELSMSRCQLNFVPMEVGGLPNITTMDLSRNQIQTIPDSICNLTSLTSLNLMGNQLTSLPKDIGELRQLGIFGLKSNRLQQLPQSFTQLQSLVELFITDNALTSLPQGFGALSSLVKLQASFNDLTSLPPDLTNLQQLELMRVAVCKLGQLSFANTADQGHHGSAALPRLAWFSLGGNQAMGPLPPPRSDLITFKSDDISDMCTKLGDGASGEVNKAVIAATGQEVAVKTFMSDVSPDGRTDEEIAIACALDHPNLTKVIGMIPNDMGPPQLVMQLVEGTPLAAKPTSQHLLRCKWAPDTTFTLQQCVKIANGVTSALAYLHSKHICHGDVYAHNVLVNSSTWHATLCDFGASFPFHADQAFWQAMEVRGFGLLLKDLVNRLDESATGKATSKQLTAIVTSCLNEDPMSRPSFTEVVNSLQPLLNQ